MKALIAYSTCAQAPSQVDKNNLNHCSIPLLGHAAFNYCWYYTILAVRKVGHLNIKTIMFYFEARVLIGWLANNFASQPMRTRASKLNICVFMLRWPTFRTASIYNCAFILFCPTCK